mmetsp:Transcript_12682/g.18502  ORF Transcript_12682/g.18502 Transcript_12682/m.18502 type:complete len:96 (+) Transcript_12682:41-328(+)
MAGEITQEDIQLFQDSMAAFMGENDDSKVEVMFKLIDRNGNGKIEKDEFRNFVSKVEKVNLSDEEVEEFMKMADTNGDGFVDLNEFFNCLKQKRG